MMMMVVVVVGLYRRGRLHELTSCRSIQSAPHCRRQAEIKRAQIVRTRSQPHLPRSTSSTSPESK